MHPRSSEAAGPPDASRGATRAQPAPAPSALPSADLLRGRDVVHIEHNGALYQLRSTRLGKLILTK